MGKKSTAVIKDIVDVFQLLRLLEQFDIKNTYRFLPDPRLTMSAAAVRLFLDDERFIRFGVMGLYGIDSPLPLDYLSIAVQDTPLSECFRAFLDIFNHQLYCLLYAVLKHCSPLMLLESEAYLDLLIAISGRQLSKEDKSEFAYASLLGCLVKSMAGLSYIIAQFLQVRCIIKQNQWRWVNVSDMPVLGCSLILANNSLLGGRVIDAMSSIQICLGPISINHAFSLIANKEKLRRLQRLIDRAISPQIRYQIHALVLVEPSLALHLGKSQSLYLGLKSWLGCLSCHQFEFVLRLSV